MCDNNNMIPLTDAKIISMYEAGFSIQDIFETYGIPVELLRRVLASNDIKIRENKML